MILIDFIFIINASLAFYSNVICTLYNKYNKLIILTSTFTFFVLSLQLKFSRNLTAYCLLILS